MLPMFIYLTFTDIVEENRTIWKLLTTLLLVSVKYNC